MNSYLVKILEMPKDEGLCNSDEDNISPTGLNKVNSTSSLLGKGRARGAKGGTQQGSQHQGDEMIQNMTDSQAKKLISMKLC